MKQSNVKTIHSDDIMNNLHVVIASDLNIPLPVNRRDDLYVDYDRSPVYELKSRIQVRDFLKRYIFQNDVYAPHQLERKTVGAFIKTQSDLGSVKPSSTVVHAVLQKARMYVKSIVGQYDLQEHMAECRFGSRAAKCVTRKRGSLDLRLETISGTRDHLRFLSAVKKQDALLASITPRRNYRVIDDLELVCVPKSWKTYRTITPDSVAGGFYTAGLGRILARRLRRFGLDIRYLSDTHQRLARQNSKSRHLATADLSKASDSFSAWMMIALLPRKWWNALKRGRASYVMVNGVRIYLNSFMAMGIGFTFPLQTILFYSLLRAIQDLCGAVGRVSVFGDDLIYPRKMHKYVASIFPKIGFTLNMDKTFAERNFRESCGGDFYHGVDVRPCMPEGQGRVMKAIEGEAFLYKLYNSLSRRWDLVHELPKTQRYLLDEIQSLNPYPYVVPGSYPDYAGLKGVPETRLFQSYPRKGPIGTAYSLPDCLQIESPMRYVGNEVPYYWQALSATYQRDDDLQPTSLDERIEALLLHPRDRVTRTKWELHLPASTQLVYKKKSRRSKTKAGAYIAVGADSLIYRRCVHRRAIE